MDTFNWQDKIALVTGASSGIGAATARELARHGLKTLLVARRGELLDRLAAEIRAGGGAALAFPADLSQESERQRLHEQVQAAAGPIDVLVNNAGFGWYGYYADMPWPTALDMMQVNIGAAAHLTRLFLPEMRARNAGHIINIGSISGEIPSQGVALYSASKSFINALTTALHRELSGTRVHVSVVRAGPVRSEFFHQTTRRSNGLSIPVERFAIPCEQVAARIWGLLRRPRRAIYVPRILGLTPWVELLFGWLEDRIGPLLLRYQAHR